MVSELDEQHFVALLGKLIGEAKHLQNNPPENIPIEDRGEIYTSQTASSRKFVRSSSAPVYDVRFVKN